MHDNEHLDLDALVKTAASFSPDQLVQFMLLIPEKTRALVQNRLDSGSKFPTKEDSDIDVTRALPPTLIVEPGTGGTIDDGESPQERRPTGVNLVKLHARGAVGEVFVAFDEQLSREVALKRIRPDLPQSDRRFKRFIREAEITAKLQHPGIVPIYELSASSDAAAHYTMPLVSGSTLGELIKQAHLELSPRPNREEWKSKFRPLLIRFIAVCNAIDYAHSKNVLHRDIKPENIMIGSQGQTLVLDWGCAKNLESGSEVNNALPEIEDEALAEIFGVAPQSRMTVAGSVMGTLAFMSPEQASGDSARIGTRSDIFGLGATLFNLLTDKVAYEYEETPGSAVDDALAYVQKGKFRRVEDVDSRAPAALAAICQQAMEPDPEKRYATAGELGKDIDAFLAGGRVSAYPEPLLDKTMRFVKQHRNAFATLLAALLIGFLSLALFTLKLNQQRDKLAHVNGLLSKSVEVEKQLNLAATHREKQAQHKLYETEMLLASEASSEPGGIGRMRELVGRWSDPDLKRFRGWEWQHLEALGKSEIWKVDLDATTNRVIFTRDASEARIFDAGQSLMFKIDTEGREVLERLNLPENVTAVDFNRDQSLLAVGFSNGDVRVLRLTGKNVKPVDFKKLKSPVTDIRWNIGGDYLATSDASGELAIWQWYDRKVKFSSSGVLNQTGKQLLNWSYDGKKLSWTTGTEVREVTLQDKKEKSITRDSWIVNLCWSHEGKLLAYVGADDTIVVKDLKTKKTTRFKGHQLFVDSLQWHPSKHYLLSSSADGSVRIWNADTEKEVRQLLGHGGHVYSSAWSSDGTKVMSGGLPEDEVHVWDVSNLGSAALERELQEHPAIAWHPNGTKLAVAEGANILIQDDRGESRLIPNPTSDSTQIRGLALNPTGERIACSSASGRIWTIDAKDGKTLKVYDKGSNENLFPEITCKSVAWSLDGKFLAGVGSGGRIRVWDESTGTDVAQEISDRYKKPLVIAWSPMVEGMSATLAFAGAGNAICIFDPREKKVVKQMSQSGWKTGLHWSPNGKKIAVSNRRGINVWDVESTERIGKCEGPSAMIRDLSWSSSQNRIAAVAEDGMLCIWNAGTFEYCAKFKLHQRAPYSVRWSPDGKQLVSTAKHGRIVFQSIADAETTDAESPPSPDRSNEPH